MKKLAALGALALLSGCIHYRNAPAADNGTAAPQGTAVGLGQPVQVGTLIVTPLSVIEDSRCPENARCVWAGRLVVATRIDGPGWRETPELALGESYTTPVATVTLVSGLPEKRTDVVTAPGEYRFVYDGRN
jgi:hypothetical protein